MNSRRYAGQTSMLDEIIVDNFAGGGGASTGIELATGRVVDIAVNHDPDAILMHQTNHPHTTHYQASVWDIDPREVCRGRPAGLAWFSPDCKHFSKAKGGKPVDKHIRGLAWIALRWAGTVRPRVIILENVEEFQTWGPVRKGRPVKSKVGSTFRKFISQLRVLDYDVEWRELTAADYGVPTIRKRFFLVARCDGRPIVWPEPTHAPADSSEAQVGRKKPWRSAAEIIDWSLPCPSIFDSKAEIREKYGLSAQRPLKPNTLRRIARGLDKFVLKETKPFLLSIGYGERVGQKPRIQDIERPLNTAVSTGKQYLAQPYLVQCKFDNTPRGTGEPLSTVTAVGSHLLAAPALIQYHTEQSDYVRGQALDRPINTVDAANRYGLMAPALVKYYSGDHAHKADSPLHTVTARDREGLTAAHIVKFKGQDVGQHPTTPLHTVTTGGGAGGKAGGNCYGVVITTICKAQPGVYLHYWPQVRELLNTYCGYHLADDEIILLWIGGAAYFIANIGLRMLTPRELYAANGFPEDYIIDRDYLGNAYPKNEQVARCGNAVCPPLATALVRANLPEWCEQPAIRSMTELERTVAAG